MVSIPHPWSELHKSALLSEALHRERWCLGMMCVMATIIMIDVGGENAAECAIFDQMLKLEFGSRLCWIKETRRILSTLHPEVRPVMQFHTWMNIGQLIYMGYAQLDDMPGDEMVALHPAHHAAKESDEDEAEEETDVNDTDSGGGWRPTPSHCALTLDDIHINVTDVEKLTSMAMRSSSIVQSYVV